MVNDGLSGPRATSPHGLDSWSSAENIMVIMGDYMRRIEEQDLPELRKQLEPLASGEMHLAERKFGATEWTDVTEQQIEMLMRSIASYETILAELHTRFG